jgi:hypothetical protein
LSAVSAVSEPAATDELEVPASEPPSENPIAIPPTAAAARSASSSPFHLTGRETSGG